jgi:lipopolysaccharide biosynthesis glycosyltransferase
MTEPFHIAFGINEAFSDQLRVLCASLFAHHEKGSLCLHILHAGLSPYQEAHLKAQAQAHQSSCHFHYIPHSRVKELPVKKNFPSSVQYHRLFISEFIPAGISKVLYLDTDIIVCRSLAPLMNEDLNGCIVGAIEDLDVKDSLKRLTLPPDSGYFNSGVLLIDLPLWISNNVPARVKSFLCGDRDRSIIIKYPDQDALNTVLNGTRHAIPLPWNTYACYRWFQPHELSPAQQAAIQNPGLIHFIGPEKPWLPNFASPYQKQYLSYAHLAGVKFPVSFSLKAFWQRRQQYKRLQTMRKRHHSAGLLDDF